jgi:hypothetical protein
MTSEPEQEIPVLTDEVDTPEDAGPDRETLIAELQTQLSASAFALTEDIMRTAFAEMEASIFEQITGRLRRELPEMIDTLLRERLGNDEDF